MTSGQVKFSQRQSISIVLLFILGLIIVKPLLAFHEQDFSPTDCLEFGHIHMAHNAEDATSDTKSDKDCHGAQILGSAVLAISFLDFTDLFLKITFEYAPFFKSDYKNPDLVSQRKPPKFY